MDKERRYIMAKGLILYDLTKEWQISKGKTGRTARRNR